MFSKKLLLKLGLVLLTSLHLCSDDLTNLYNGLDPLSLAEHIAFYKLHSEHEAGKKALTHAQHLLTKGQEDRFDVSHFPAMSSSIDGFVSLLIGKEGETSFLDEESLEAIEVIGQCLSNRSLKGHKATSEKEVLALEDHEIDLARATLLSQQSTDQIDWHWIRHYEAKLDFLALQVVARLPVDPTPEQIIKNLNLVLFFDLKYRYPNQHIQDQHNLFSELTSVLDLNQGVCLGTSVVYLCLAQRLNLPLEIITPPGHIYLRYNNDGDITNIETTHRGIHVDCNHYESINVKYLKQITLKETVGLIFNNLAGEQLMQKDYPKAISFYQKGALYAPKDPLIGSMLGYAYLLDHQTKEARRTFDNTAQADDQIAAMDLHAHQDFFDKKASHALIEAALIQPNDNTLDCLQEKRAVLEQELKKYPKCKLGWLVLAGIYYELSMPQLAIEALETIHSLSSEIPVVEFQLAVLHHHHFNSPAAWKHFKCCKKLLKKEDLNPKQFQHLEQSLSSTSLPID